MRSAGSRDRAGGSEGADLPLGLREISREGPRCGYRRTHTLLRRSTHFTRAQADW